MTSLEKGDETVGALGSVIDPQASTGPGSDGQPASPVLALIETGGELAGAVTGAAVALVGGPEAAVGGAVAGVFVTRALKRVGTEISDRILGSRQRLRVGAAYTFAAAEIARRLGEGEVPRDDWFGASPDSWNEGDAALEGVLLAAQNAWEEKKVRHLGYLYANLAFSNYDSQFAYYLIALAKRLTFRQLTSMAIIGDRRQKGWTAFDWGQGRSMLMNGLDWEVDSLSNDGLAGFVQGDGSIARPSATIGGGRINRMPIERLGLTQIGQILLEAMRLDLIAAGDIDSVLMLMKGPGDSTRL